MGVGGLMEKLKGLDLRIRFLTPPFGSQTPRHPLLVAVHPSLITIHPSASHTPPLRAVLFCIVFCIHLVKRIHLAEGGV